MPEVAGVVKVAEAVPVVEVVAVAAYPRLNYHFHHYGYAHACAVLSIACCQFESHSFAQWQLLPTLLNHTTQILRKRERQRMKIVRKI